MSGVPAMLTLQIADSMRPRRARASMYLLVASRQLLGGS